MTKATGDALAERIGTAQAEQGKTLTAFDLLNKMQGEFARALPSVLSVDRFMRVALTEIKRHPELEGCTAESLLGALVTAAQLGLEPGGPLGQFYLTPRRIRVNGEQVWQVVPIIGYQGLLDLARRAGVGAIDTILVRDGDHYRQGANESRGRFFEWEPIDDDETREITNVVTLAHLAGAARPQWDALPIAAVEARKARGAAGDRGPWASDREAMIRKTGIRALASRLPQTTELSLARRADEQVQTYRVGDVLELEAAAQ